MAIETLYATSHITGNFLNPTNAVGNTPTTWAGELNVGSSPTSRWAMGDTVESPFGTVTFGVTVRKGTNSGNPTFQVNAWQNGVLIANVIPSTSVTSTTGVEVTGTLASTSISDFIGLELEIVVSGAGGGPSVRNSAQVSHMRYSVDTQPFVVPGPPENVTAASASSTSVKVDWTAPLTGTAVSTYNVKRNGVVVGNTSGSTLTFTDTGLTASTTYAYTVSATNSAGTGVDSASVNATTPAPAIVSHGWAVGVPL